MREQVFVGRAGQRARLDAALVRSGGGAASVVLVLGEPGGGKSALLAATAAGASATVLAAAADEAETGLPYGVLDQLWQQLGDARLPDGPRDPFHEGARLRAALDAATAPGPLLLLLDDLHLADAPSLAALTFAVRRLPGLPVLTVLAARPERLSRLPPGLLRLVEREGEVLTLAGLDPEEVAQLAAASGFGRVTPAAAERLRDHSGGSPLLLRALLRELTPAQVEDRTTPLSATPSLTALTGAALDRLSGPARELVSAAAVLGPRTPLPDVTRLAAVRDAVADPWAAVAELERSGLARLEAGPDGPALVLTHALTQVAVLDLLAAPDRAALHRAAAGLTTGDAQLRHRVAAAAGPDPVLVAALHKAADRAGAHGSWRAAAQWLLEAARLDDPGPARDDALVDAVELLLRDGDVVAATGLADRVAALPAGPRRLQVQARTAWLAGQLPLATDLARQAWQLAGDDRATRAQVALMLGQLVVLTGQGERAAEWALQALPDLPRTEQPGARRLAAFGLAMHGRPQEALGLLDPGPRDAGVRGSVLLWAGDVTAARDALLTADARLQHGAGGDHYDLSMLAYLVEVQFRCGDWDAAEQAAERLLALVEDTGQVWLRAFAHSTAALVPAARGRSDEAERHVAAALEAAEALGENASAAWAHNAAVHVAACRSDPDAVQAAAAWALTDPQHDSLPQPPFFGWPVQHAAALVYADRLEEAAHRLDLLEAQAAERGWTGRRAALSRVRGELAARQRDTAAARAAFAQAEQLGAGVADALEAALLQAAYGRFLRRRGERRAAAERLTRARDALRALGAQPLLEDCERELAGCALQRSASPDVGRLTPQEAAVARLVGEGRTNAQAAATLGLSAKTISYHLAHVFEKLQVRSRTELALRLASEPIPGERPGRRTVTVPTV